VGHHAAQVQAALAEDAGDVDQYRVLCGQAGAMAVAIDFDPHVEAYVMLLCESDDGLGALDAVGKQAEVAAFAPQGQGLGQFAWGDGHGVEHIAYAGGETMLGFLEGGHCDTAGPGGDLGVDHRQALAGLDMRAQAHAQAVHALLHALDIALHLRDVDERGGRVEGSNRRGHGGTRVAGDRLHSTQLLLTCGSIDAHQSLSKIE
jgi:hypothetical protein